MKFAILFTLLLFLLGGCLVDMTTNYENTIPYDEANNIYLHMWITLNPKNEIVSANFQFVDENGENNKGSNMSLNQSTEQYSDYISENASFPSEEDVAGNELDYDLIKQCYDGANLPGDLTVYNSEVVQ